MEMSNEQIDQSKRKKNKVFQIIRNKYLLITVFFIVWMLFFDNNNWVYLSELSEFLNTKKSEKLWYQKEINEAERQIKELTTDQKALEKFGRENYYMKRKDEDVYIFLSAPDSTDHSH